MVGRPVQGICCKFFFRITEILSREKLFHKLVLRESSEWSALSLTILVLRRLDDGFTGKDKHGRVFYRTLCGVVHSSKSERTINRVVLLLTLERK